MSYDIIKKEMGKAPIAVLELDLDFCQNTYGVLPCTASGPSPQKCFNTFATCQDKQNFIKEMKTYRFSSLRIDDLQSPGDPPTFPTLMSLSTAPTRLEPAKGLGIRSSVKIKIQDHPWTDEGIDPYIRERDYNPDERGSFWARFLARNLFWQNRLCRVKQGYLNSDGTYSDANMTTRLYILNSISGPDSKGIISITAKDILKLADRERAQIPTASEATLVNSINSTQTSFSIIDSQAKIKNAFDSGQTYAIIDNEVIRLTNVFGSGGNYSVTCNRATMPNFYSEQPEADDHEAGSTIQDCFFYSNQRVDNIFFDLLGRVASIPSQYLDTVQWDSKINEGLQGYLFSRLIVEPTGVKDLLTELTEHTVTIWWDERAQKVLMDTLFDHTPNGSFYNDFDHLIENTVNSTVDIKGRVSQVWIYLGIRSPLLTDGDAKDYRQVVIRADLDFENEFSYGSPSIKKIKSSWMPSGLGSVASEIASRLVRNYRLAKTTLVMSLDAKDDDNWTGDKIEVETRYVKDDFGLDKRLTYKIIEVDEQIKPKGTKFKYMLQSEISVDQEAIGVITPTLDPSDGVSPFPDYRNAQGFQREQYAFISDGGSDTFPDGKRVNEIQ